jgi:hypothetical protein
MKTLLRVEKALDEPFADAWPRSLVRIRAELPSDGGEHHRERVAWIEALEWARPFYAVAYEGGALPEAASALNEAVAYLDDEEGRTPARVPAHVSSKSTISQEMRARWREHGLTGDRPGKRPDRRGDRIAEIDYE